MRSVGNIRLLSCPKDTWIRTIIQPYVRITLHIPMHHLLFFLIFFFVLTPGSGLRLGAELALASEPLAPGLQATLQSVPRVHDLRVQLDPRTGTLHGHSIIRPGPINASTLDLLLHPRMRINSVHFNGQPVRFQFNQGRLRLNLGMERIDENGVISVDYSGVFHDPVPMSQFSMDNPGFGVNATITEQGVFFQGQSGWFPRLPGHESPIRLEVVAPRGILAVTSGRLLGHENREDQSISRWHVEQLGRGMPLSAGRYTQRRLETKTIPIYTYLFPETDHLAQTYLEASARHVATYESLHGPYPFDHFAVVENFFPSGFGMPSYTLLGSAILRLPFIPETSLRHEVAHCWWGNGVYVDYSQGNWSEGLTTYVADYLAQEEQSAEAAREYRLRILRDYALLAADQADFPVSRFLSRSDPATQVVGYGKAMYLLHMIRQRLGDDPFWDALRAFYDQWLFKAATWQNMFQAFQDAGWDDQERKIFAKQWLLASGAPVLRLSNVLVENDGLEWNVSAMLSQDEPFFNLIVPVRLETASSIRTLEIPLNGESASFSLKSRDRPVRLLVDPDHHLFRLLAPQEIPPTVNSIKGASRLLVIRGEALKHVPVEIVRAFLGSLNQPRAEVLSEDEALDRVSGSSHLLFFGAPKANQLRRLLAPPVPYKLEYGENHPLFHDPSEPSGLDTLFFALPHPDQANGVVAVFNPSQDLNPDAIADTARRITHYGKDSYLGFLEGENRLRGTWPSLASPLIKDLVQ